VSDVALPSSGPRPGLPRWLLIPLVVSLGLNLLVTGLAIGHRWHMRSIGPDLAGDVEHARSFVGRLPAEQRAKIRQIFLQHRGELRGRWQEVRQNREEVIKALAAEPFDRAAYVAAMSRFLETETRVRVAAQPVFAEVASTLTAEQRREFLRYHRVLRRALGPDGKVPPEKPAEKP
jgi:uncharacterized membrane protein